MCLAVFVQGRYVGGYHTVYRVGHENDHLSSYKLDDFRYSKVESNYNTFVGYWPHCYCSICIDIVYLVSEYCKTCSFGFRFLHSASWQFLPLVFCRIMFGD